MTSTGEVKRLCTIDSMRGIAAMAVALNHIGGAAFAGHPNGLLSTMSGQGYLGVAVFFVISGFVISSSLENRAGSAKFIGGFMLRRSIRLDPTYWCSLAVELSLICLAMHLLLPNPGMPDFKTILLNAFYLQNLTGVGDIVGVHWTLCIEIQFYLFYALLLAVPKHSRWFLFALTIAVAIAMNTWAPPGRTFFLPHWLLFALGVLAHQAGNKRIPRWAFSATFAAVIATHMITQTSELLAGCITAFLLYQGARIGRLGSWLDSRFLLYFGSRSYSIYLFHAIIGERVIGVTDILGRKLMIPNIYAWDMAQLAIGMAASLMAAEVVYRLVELPSLRLSKRIGSVRKLTPVPVGA